MLNFVMRLFFLFMQNKGPFTARRKPFSREIVVNSKWHTWIFPKCFHWVQQSVTKIFVTAIKVFEPAISCVRDQDVTTVPARHMCRSKYLLQWFIRLPGFPEFLFHIAFATCGRSSKERRVTHCLQFSNEFLFLLCALIVKLKYDSSNLVREE